MRAFRDLPHAPLSASPTLTELKLLLSCTPVSCACNSTVTSCACNSSTHGYSYSHSEIRAGNSNGAARLDELPVLDDRLAHQRYGREARERVAHSGVDRAAAGRAAPPLRLRRGRNGRWRRRVRAQRVRVHGAHGRAARRARDALPAAHPERPARAARRAARVLPVAAAVPARAERRARAR